MARRWRHPRQWPRAAWSYFTSSLIIVTCPCWCLPIWGWVEYDDYQIRKRNSSKEFQKRRASYAPSPMPDQRERDLEIPLEHPVPVRESQSRLKSSKRATTLQQTRSQQQCLLLQKLPLEVRLLIWEHCIGGELLHIVREPGRLGHVICPFRRTDPLLDFSSNPFTSEATRMVIEECTSPNYTSNHICWSPEDADGLSYARTPESGLSRLNIGSKQAFLPLLQTCRQVYSEALPILYQTNVFDIKSLDALLYLPRTTIHVDMIRTLRLSWDFCADPLRPRLNANPPPGRRSLFADAIPPFDLDTWLRACTFLSKMKGLQQLVLIIEGDGWAEQSPESASQLLLPLAGVKVGRIFEVHVPWESNEWEDAVVELVARQQKNEDGGEVEWLEDISWARMLLEETVQTNSRGRRMPLLKWKGMIKSRAKEMRSFKEVAVKEPDVEKGKEREKEIMNNTSEVSVRSGQDGRNVGFEIVRREELLRITKLPTYPARKKHGRNKAFGRR
ncbi:MAG: hypothetical protein Q9165_007435 [Trypethelium subeluteriae]